jgi:hypothetical protein
VYSYFKNCTHNLTSNIQKVLYISGPSLLNKYISYDVEMSSRSHGPSRRRRSRSRHGGRAVVAARVKQQDDEGELERAADDGVGGHARAEQQVAAAAEPGNFSMSCGSVSMTPSFSAYTTLPFSFSLSSLVSRSWGCRPGHSRPGRAAG